MRDQRTRGHPIIAAPEGEPSIPFYWNGEKLLAQPGEVISSALFAAGIHTFGHHARDGSPLGMFCANGQCAQCTVIVNGVAVKSCMTPVVENCLVTSCDRAPDLPVVEDEPRIEETCVTTVEVLIIGAGPAGLTAAIELGRHGISTLMVDDKDRPGGKLVLQTHKFFGSVEDCSAGTRGIDIATNLAEEVNALESVETWLEATAIGVFSDGRVGVVRDGTYHLIEPDALLVAAGAREKQLPFPGHTLPGVYGAGAFQTLLNRDLVRPCERLFVIGGGNVGLIAAYHALQADIEVIGLCEAMPSVGGYNVHADKIRRLGVPVHVGHSVVAVHGEDSVEAITIAEVDSSFTIQPGTEMTYEVDTVLVAVGLSPLAEFIVQAREAKLPVYAAGDADEIAEASAAMFGGKIEGLRIARDLGRDVPDIPPEWQAKADVLKARPGAVVEEMPPASQLPVYPVIHCLQEIPCNPCVTVCKKQSITIEGDELLGLPRFTGDDCNGCAKCVAICPGLAITLVDGRKDPENPFVTVPFELPDGALCEGDEVDVTDRAGLVIGRLPVVGIKNPKFANRTRLVKISAPRELASQIAGIRTQDPAICDSCDPRDIEELDDDVVVCRCEHVTAGEIRAAIRSGIRDVNEMKATLRVCMGACSGKTCPEAIVKLFKAEGFDVDQVAAPTLRPLFLEVPFGVFSAGSRAAENSE
jgi:thioredoxin reductase/Fe-S-cluster-containing hydrogenase component 2